jgi:hypothetical protein
MYLGNESRKAKTAYNLEWRCSCICRYRLKFRYYSALLLSYWQFHTQVCEGIREVLQLPAEKELSPRNTW